MSVQSSTASAIRRRAVNANVLGVVFGLIALPTGTMHGQTDTMRVAAAVALAQEANPSLQAARLGVDAARERIPQSGALPDPVLTLGLMNRPLDGFGTAEPMTMNTVQLTQQLPWPGRLGSARGQADHLVHAQEHDADEIEQQLTARVKAVYYRLAYVDRALGVMRATRELLRGFLDVASAKYAVGDGLQQDVLQAQVAVARMTEDIMVLEQERTASAARLNTLLGRDAIVPIPALELPTPEAHLPPVDSLMAIAARERPALQAARSRIDAAEAGYRAARRQLYPDFMVSLGYGQRPQYTDMVTIMLGISVPLWAGGRQLPMRREMLAEQAEQEARERELRNETYARITELRAEAARAVSLSELYAGSVLPQARAAVESALSAYRVGSVDFLTLVNNQLTVNRYEIETLRLAAEYQRAVAELEALISSDLEEGNEE